MKNISYEQLNFVIKNNPKVFIEFWSEQCKTCFLIEPFLQKIEKAYNFEIYKINIMVNEKIIEIYNLNKLPTFIYFENGAEIKKLNGFGNEMIFEKTFRPYLK